MRSLVSRFQRLQCGTVRNRARSMSLRPVRKKQRCSCGNEHCLRDAARHSARMARPRKWCSSPRGGVLYTASMTTQIGSLVFGPVEGHEELLAPAVAVALRRLPGGDVVGVAEIDPLVSDTAGFLRTVWYSAGTSGELRRA